MVLLHVDPIVSLGGLLDRSLKLEIKSRRASLAPGDTEFANSEPSPLSSEVEFSCPSTPPF
jgi:hypothetical protein